MRSIWGFGAPEAICGHMEAARPPNPILVLLELTELCETLLPLVLVRVPHNPSLCELREPLRAQLVMSPRFPLHRL